MSGWSSKGKTRQQAGYGKAHDAMRAHLLATVTVCEECNRKGRTAIGHVADHILALAKGGTGDRSNYQLLCCQCAKEKDARDRGRPMRKRPRFDVTGWPIEEE